MNFGKQRMSKWYSFICLVKTYLYIVRFQIVLFGSDTIAQYLVEQNAAVNEPSGEDAKTPLHLLFSRTAGDSPELTRFLLDHGADVHILNRDNETPLSEAFTLEKNSPVNELLQFKPVLVKGQL